MLQELREEYGDAPEKLTSFGVKPKEIEEEDRERTEYIFFIYIDLKKNISQD